MSIDYLVPPTLANKLNILNMISFMQTKDSELLVNNRMLHPNDLHTSVFS